MNKPENTGAPISPELRGVYDTAYERRVRELETEGMTRSDAQGAAAAEEMTAARSKVSASVEESTPLVDEYAKSIAVCMFRGTRAKTVKLKPDALEELVRIAFNLGAKWQREGKLSKTSSNIARECGS